MMCLCLCMCDACVQKGFIEMNSCESALRRCARARQALRPLAAVEVADYPLVSHTNSARPWRHRARSDTVGHLNNGKLNKDSRE